jgi:hypothetical protein
VHVVCDAFDSAGEVDGVRDEFVGDVVAAGFYLPAVVDFEVTGWLVLVYSLSGGMVGVLLT